MIRIETLPLSLKKPLPMLQGLTDNQKLYLQHFVDGKNVKDTVTNMLDMGRLVSFSEMYDLIVGLHKRGFIQNPRFAEFFQRLEELDKDSNSPLSNLIPSLFKKEKPEDFLQRHPFFRSQNPVITSLFAQHAEIIEAAPGTVLCRSLKMERDLYFMVEGEAAIYKPVEGQGRRLLGFCGKDAVIGEIGFFMGELRTADVIVTKASKLVRVRYDEPAFGRAINKDIASRLQVRFRLVHALAKSPFLKNIPEEAMDALLFAGKTRNVKEFEVICQEDHRGDSCYIVVSGSAVVTQKMKTIGVLTPGEAFGEIALFFTQGRRTATVMAQRDTTLLEIEAKDFYRLLGENLLLAREFEKLAFERRARTKNAG